MFSVQWKRLKTPVEELRSLSPTCKAHGTWSPHMRNGCELFCNKSDDRDMNGTSRHLKEHTPMRKPRLQSSQTTKGHKRGNGLLRKQTLAHSLEISRRSFRRTVSGRISLL